MTATKNYAVATIKNGTVIDHIHAGSALKMVKFLKLAKHQKQVTLGLNLPSETVGLKDIIKVEQLTLTPDEVNRVAILAPEATINIIKEHEVVNKYKISLPETISEVIPCNNSKCISNFENTKSLFHVIQKIGQQVRLKCHYCRSIIIQEDIN